MGENSPFARERIDVEPPVGAMLDAVALEDRLRVARELRAEAIARRQAAARPQPPAVRPTARGPGPQPADPAAQAQAAPNAPALRPRARGSAPARDGAPGHRAAHPLVALLALGLSASFVLSRPADAPPAERLTTEAAPPLAPPPSAAAQPPLATPRPVARRVEPTPEAETADVEIAAIPAAPMASPPVLSEQPPAVRPGTIAESSAEQARPSASAAESPPPAAPRPERILVNAPSNVPPDAVDATLAALRATGFGDVATQPTRLTISTSTVRYYNAEDAAAAAEIAALVGPTLPGGAAQARDFSDAPSRGAPGHLEIWIAGESPAASRREAARSAPPGGAGIDPDQIRRLVEGVMSSPAIGDLGRGASNVARDIESGANNVAREIDSAVNDAVRFFEGRP